MKQCAHQKSHISGDFPTGGGRFTITLHPSTKFFEIHLYFTNKVHQKWSKVKNFNQNYFGAFGKIISWWDYLNSLTFSENLPISLTFPWLPWHDLNSLTFPWLPWLPWQLSTLHQIMTWNAFLGRNWARQSVDCRPTRGRQMPDCQPTVSRHLPDMSGVGQPRTVWVNPAYIMYIRWFKILPDFLPAGVSA